MRTPVKKKKIVLWPISLLMLRKLKIIQSVQDKQTANFQRIDIELFVGLVHQFSVIWNTRLNGFKDYNKKKVARIAWNNISSSIDNKYSASLCFP